MDYDNYVNVPINARNIDFWIIRRSLLEVVRKALPQLEGKMLDVGCGIMPYRNLVLSNSRVTTYTGLDIEGALNYGGVKPDVTWDGRRMPFDTGAFDCALGTEVLEHAPDAQTLLNEIRRVLKPGGVLCFTTPFVWPYHESPHDFQRFTAFALEAHLEAAGFSAIEVVSIGNWHSSLAQFLGLWVARATMPKPVRAALRYPTFMLQKLLMRFDGNSAPRDQAMPRMLGGIARS